MYSTIRADPPRTQFARGLRSFVCNLFCIINALFCCCCFIHRSIHNVENNAYETHNIKSGVVWNLFLLLWWCWFLLLRIAANFPNCSRQRQRWDRRAFHVTNRVLVLSNHKAQTIGCITIYYIKLVIILDNIYEACLCTTRFTHRRIIFGCDGFRCNFHTWCVVYTMCGFGCGDRFHFVSKRLNPISTLPHVESR